jgi:pantoate--beta-alanine ligase
MKILKSISELNAYLKNIDKNKSVGFVPTMGALHDGHATLIDASVSAADITVVSIFVNPTQFGPNEDYSKYPRTEESDIKLCDAHRVDAIFMPSAADMYPSGPIYSLVPPPELTQRLCGLYRENHFSGVSTVVSKLFNIVRPDKAFFGLKDYQQYCIIKNMAKYMSYNIEIIGVETVREPSGLALSSRNKYLTTQERTQSVSIYKGLSEAKELYANGVHDKGKLESMVSETIAKGGLKPQYVTLLQAVSLSENIDWKLPVVMAIAAHTPQSNTRLIDNMVFGD